MHRELEVFARLAVLEIVVADLVARKIPDAEALKSWTDTWSERAARIAEENAPPEVSMAYSAAWDEMLASVRAAFRDLRA